MLLSRKVFTFLGLVGVSQLSRFVASSAGNENQQEDATLAAMDAAQACNVIDESDGSASCKSGGGDQSGDALEGETTPYGRRLPHRASHQCTMYLAESSISNAGFGMYTGIDRAEGSAISGPDIIHQLVDDSLPPGCYMSDLLWSALFSGGFFEALGVRSLIPGVGSTANSFYSLLNALPLMRASSTGGAEFSDISRGAFSTYIDHYYIATRPVKAGEEVFVDYGHAYFLDREKFGMVPVHSDFVWAREKVKEVLSLFNRDISQEVWDAIRGELAHDARKSNALPKKASDLPGVATSDAPWYYIPNNPRTIDWLDENGFCLDLLERRVSSIRHAGQGAFAKSFISEGTIVTPVPLVHLRRSDLHVRLNGGGDDETLPRSRNPHQQLLNYCFGHNESSMLLCPYSNPPHLINHNSIDPNVKLVWSPPASYHLNDWFDMSTDDILDIDHPGLMMHVVAKRDIFPDEEVTLDYGPNWEKAWLDHVKRVEDIRMTKSNAESEGENHHVTAAEMNQREETPRTIFEQVDNPYPDNIATVCHYHFGGTDHMNESKYPPMYVNEPETAKDPSGPFDYLHPAADNTDELQRMKEIYDEIIEKAPSWGNDDVTGRYLRPCKVIARQYDDSEKASYLVRVFNRHDMGEDAKIQITREHYVQRVPRSAILYVDKPYTSDAHHPNAFRHEIGIPDEIFPTAWKDMASGSSLNR
jgi:hypothetical protein